MKLRLMMIAVVAGLTLFTMQLEAQEKTLIAVASNFLKPAQQLAKAYEEASGYKVEISAGSTGKLYAQIINGAPYAVFLAANAREPQRLETEARIVSGSRFTYALGKLVLWSRDSELLKQQPETVLSEGRFKTIAIANPKTAPYGAAGVKVLNHFNPEHKGGWRLIRAENVGQAYQYTYTGAAQLGFIAWSQLLTSSDPQLGSYWLVPEHLYDPIKQQAVLLKAGEGNPAASGFLEFLKSATGKEMIRSFGYGVE